jgi:predicted PurR-regulated permease PerM
MRHMYEKIRHYTQHGSHHGFGKVKKILIIAAVAGLAILIAIIILVVMAFNWLFSQGGQKAQEATQGVTNQVQQLSSPLSLESYIQGNQVDTARLEQMFNSIPSQLQGLWLSQFQSQLQDLQQQAGIPQETLKALTDTYNSLKQLAGN